MSKEEIQCALVVGSGSIAQRHIRNLRGHFPDATVLCVTSSGRAAKASEVGASAILPDISTAIKHRPDLAIVASPAPYHLKNAEPLLAAGVPVLIEKPLCSALSELEQTSLHQYDARLGVAYNLRFLPATRTVKKLLEEGFVGAISTAFAEVGQYLPDWRPNSDYRKGVSARKELGGGALLELSHELDYLNWFFGPFSRALGVIRNTGILGVDVDDNVDAMLGQPSGLLVHVHLDFLQRQACRRFKAIGERGTIVWDLMANEVCVMYADGGNETVYSEPKYDRNQMYVDQMMSFIKFSKSGGAFDSTLQSGIEVMHLIEAIRASNSTHTWASVESGL